MSALLLQLSHKAAALSGCRDTTKQAQETGEEQVQQLNGSPAVLQHQSLAHFTVCNVCVAIVQKSNANETHPPAKGQHVGGSLNLSAAITCNTKNSKQ